MVRKRCQGCPSRSGPPFFATSERQWLGFTRSTLAILQKTWCRRDEKTDHRQAGLLPRPSLESASEAILSAVRRVSCEIRPAVVHRDLYLPNTLVAAGRFRCLLDFEHARSTDPLSDFVKLAMWVFEKFPGSESEFRSGYGSDPLMTKDGGMRYHVAMGLELLSGLVYWKTTGQSAMLADYQRRLGQWLAQS